MGSNCSSLLAVLLDVALFVATSGNKKGHVERDCKKRRATSAQAPDSSPTTAVATSATKCTRRYENGETWIAESGASRHMAHSHAERLGFIPVNADVSLAGGSTCTKRLGKAESQGSLGSWTRCLVWILNEVVST